LPSTNSTESFGIVQVESMACGTPVVASDLPGVREPVKLTGMGRLTPVADSKALAGAVNDILAQPRQFQGDVEAVRQHFSSQRIAADYEKLFQEVIQRKRS